MKYKGGGTNMTLNQAIGDAAGRLYLATAGFYHAVLSQITEDELSRDKHLEHTIHAANASSIADYRALTRGLGESGMERQLTRTQASAESSSTFSMVARMDGPGGVEVLSNIVRGGENV